MPSQNEIFKHREMMGSKGSISRFIEYRGEYLSPQVSELKQHTAREDDVYLATFPKSGTYWVYNIINMLIQGKANYSERYNMIGYNTVFNIDRLSSPRLLGTHFQFSWLPDSVKRNRNTKIINLFRNPKDTCVSLYHYSKKCSYYHGDWDDFYELFCKGDVWTGSWFEHFKTWETVRRETPNVLFLKYEDLKTDFRNQLLRLASYLGVSYEEEFYDSVQRRCQFEVMKKDESIVEKSFGSKIKDPLFRKGKIGDWKNYFTEAQSKQLDVLYANTVKHSDEEFQFE